MRRNEQGRGLRAVVFVDTVGSTQIATTLGDKRWQELLRRELIILRRLLKERGGQEVDTAGDGLFALFREPAPAVRFAASACEAVRVIGLEIRAGVHFGEVEFSDGRPGGIVVHTGARAMSVGAGGEVLVTQTVRELVSGGDLSFTDHGTHSLKGIPGTSALYRLKEIDDQPVAAPLTEGESAERMQEFSQQPPLVKRRTFLAAAGVTAVAGGAAAATFVLTGSEKRTHRPSGMNRIIRFDPGSREERISPYQLPPVVNERPGLVIGEGAVWASDVGLHRIDPRDGSLTGTVDDLPKSGWQGTTSALAIGLDDVWIASETVVLRIDPADNELLDSLEFSTTAESLTVTTAIAVGGGYVWLTKANGKLYRIATLGGLTTDDTIQVGGLPSDLVIAHGGIWIADSFGNVIRVDARTRRMSPPIETGGTLESIAATEDSVWVVDRGGLVFVVDVTTERRRQSIPVPGLPVDVATGLDAVWIADLEGDRLVQINETTLVEVAEFPLSGPPAAIAVDEERGLIWVRTAGGSDVN